MRHRDRARQAVFGDMTEGARHAVVYLFFLSVLIGAASITFTIHHSAVEDHRWCEVLRDPASAAQARDFAALYRQFGCPVP